MKIFCAVPHLLCLLKDYILFAEKDEELQKYILRQHQTAAVERVVDRALDARRTRASSPARFARRGVNEDCTTGAEGTEKKRE